MTSKKWYLSKTVWTSIGAIVAAIGAYATLDALFIRDGVGTIIKK